MLTFNRSNTRRPISRLFNETNISTIVVWTTICTALFYYFQCKRLSQQVMVIFVAQFIIFDLISSKLVDLLVTKQSLLL